MIGAIVATIRRRRKGKDTNKSPKGSPKGLKVSKTKSSSVLLDEETIVGVLPRQGDLKAIYDSIAVQVSVASVILLNFLVSICEYQMLPPEDSPAITVFVYFELSFNTVFLIELIINFYSNFFVAFWKSPWNVFDFVIVAIAWLAVFVPGIPGITVLRLFRAFRVFKLFKKIEAIRVIMVGITRSLPGVGNAFVLLCLVMGIWSIMGVQFFRLDFPDEFGTFSKAMLTMFQLATFDSWVSGVARPVVLHKNASVFGAPFFISYAFMSAIIMMNVVVAILLDKFIMASKEVKEDLVREKKAKALAQEQRLLTQAAVVLQTVVREYRIPIATKRLLRRSRMSAVTIQKTARGWLARRRVKVRHKEYRAQLGLSSDSPVKGERGERLDGGDEADKSRIEAMKEVRRRIMHLEARFENWQLETMDLVRQILARTSKSQLKVSLKDVSWVEERVEGVDLSPGTNCSPKMSPGWLCHSSICTRQSFISSPRQSAKDPVASRDAMISLM